MNSLSFSVLFLLVFAAAGIYEFTENDFVWACVNFAFVGFEIAEIKQHLSGRY